MSWVKCSCASFVVCVCCALLCVDYVVSKCVPSIAEDMSLGVPASGAVRLAHVGLGKGSSDDADTDGGGSVTPGDPSTPSATGTPTASGAGSIAGTDDAEEQMSEAMMATALAVVEMAGVVDGAGMEQLKPLSKVDNSFLCDPRYGTGHGSVRYY